MTFSAQEAKYSELAAALTLLLWELNSRSEASVRPGYLTESVIWSGWLCNL